MIRTGQKVPGKKNGIMQWITISVEEKEGRITNRIESMSRASDDIVIKYWNVKIIQKRKEKEKWKRKKHADF